MLPRNRPPPKNDGARRICKELGWPDVPDDIVQQVVALRGAKAAFKRQGVLSPAFLDELGNRSGFVSLNPIHIRSVAHLPNRLYTDPANLDSQGGSGGRYDACLLRPPTANMHKNAPSWMLNLGAVQPDVLCIVGLLGAPESPRKAPGDLPYVPILPPSTFTKVVDVARKAPREVLAAPRSPTGTPSIEDILRR